MSVAIQPDIRLSNANKMATNIILFPFTGNGLRIYPSIIT